MKTIWKGDKSKYKWPNQVTNIADLIAYDKIHQSIAFPQLYRQYWSLILLYKEHCYKVINGETKLLRPVKHVMSPVFRY